MALNCESLTAHDKPRPFEKRPCTDKQTVPQSIPIVPTHRPQAPPPPHPLPRAFVRHLSPGGRALENLCPGVEHFSVLLEAF